MSFGLDGNLYEIDLNRTHADELREVLDPYISSARKISGAGGGRRNSGAATPTHQRLDSDIDASAVRAWAQSNGVEVSPRGRIALALGARPWRVLPQPTFLQHPRGTPPASVRPFWFRWGRSAKWHEQCLMYVE